MKIDRKLSLVVPIERDAESLIYCYSMPIGRPMYERYHRVISRTMAQIFSDYERATFFSGPANTALILREIAESTARLDGTGSWWSGDDGVGGKLGLMAEIRRLTTVLIPTEAGWQTIQYDEALKKDVFTEDEAAEVEGAICFFTFASFMRGNQMVNRSVIAAAATYQWQLISSTLTEFRTGLMISTKAESTAEAPTAQALSIPS